MLIKTLSIYVWASLCENRAKNDTLDIASLEYIRFPKHFRKIWLMEMIKSEGNVSFSGRYISEVY